MDITLCLSPEFREIALFCSTPVALCFLCCFRGHKIKGSTFTASFRFLLLLWQIGVLFKMLLACLVFATLS